MIFEIHVLLPTISGFWWAMPTLLIVIGNEQLAINHLHFL